MKMKASTTDTLMTTMMLLTVADSETPRTKTKVTRPTITIAGRLITPVAITWPAPSMTGTPGAAVSTEGTMIPMLRNRLTQYPDQLTATVDAARPYSSKSSKPMIHAGPSPIDAYVYE